MKICFLAGASSIHTVRWVNAMAERGHDVHLITMHHVTVNQLDKRVHIYPLKIPAPLGYYTNFIEAKLLLNKIMPDILHVHYASGYGTLARFIRFKPTLLSVWGSDVYLFPYQSKRNEKILRKNVMFAHQITATGYALKEQTENFIPPETSIEVIPFGIDVDQFNKKKQRYDDIICIGTVKGLKEVYGIDILLHATAKLLQFLRENQYEQVAEKIKLMIVGAGPQLEALQQLAKTLKVEMMTEFVGAVPNERVPEYLNQLDIYCAFSRSESFGVAVLEASACEVPVVVSDVGGLPEVVQDKQTGYVVNYEETDEIVSKLFDLVMNKTKRETFGKNGREFVKKYYDWNQNVIQMEKVYQALLT